MDFKQGFFSPHTDVELSEYGAMSSANASRKIIRDNINALMRDHPVLYNNAKLAERAKVGTGTISRLRNASVAATADMIDAIAEAFGVQPWQLLAAGKATLPTLPKNSGDEYFVSKSDWLFLQGIKMVITDAEEAEFKKRSERASRIAAEQPKHTTHE